MSFLRNTEFCRRVVLSNNFQTSRYASSRVSSPRGRKSQQSPNPEKEDASPTTSTDEKPVKKRRKRRKGIVEVDGDASPAATTLKGEQINNDPKHSKDKKDKKGKKDKKEVKRGKSFLQPGEVLPDFPAGVLPPINAWRKYFPAEKFSANRSVVRKPETAAMLADVFVPEGSKDKIIIEASPGPGQLTRALLALPKERVKKIFVLEPAKSYLKYLKPLEQLDSRVKVYPQHGMDWQVYTNLKNDGAFDEVASTDWKEVHPQLQFIMHMNTRVDGEQLLSQFLRCIPNRQWLFHHGRVPLNLVIPARMWERLNAAEKTVARCKLSVIAQATADLRLCVDPAALQPYKLHFHPELLYGTGETPDNKGYLEPRRLGTPHMAISVLPLEHQQIAAGDLDVWDFVLRKLFVLKATSIETCLNSNVLGPGSSNLLPKLTNPSLEGTFNPKTNGPRDLNVREWSSLVEVFKNWPFKPDSLAIGSIFDNGT